MALIETVATSICCASHSKSWSRSWRSADAMISMDRLLDECCQALSANAQVITGADGELNRCLPGASASSVNIGSPESDGSSRSGKRPSCRGAQPGLIPPRTPVDFETPIWLKTNLQEPEWSGVGCVLRDDRSGFHQGAMPTHQCEQSLIVQPANCPHLPAPQQWQRDRH